MPKHVLLVIGDEDAAAIYTTYLTVAASFLVHRVSTSFQGLEFSVRSMPDLIVTDYPMYVERDKSVVRALRESGIEVPIIAVSVQHDPRIIGRAYEEGVTHYLRAPISPSEIAEFIRRLMDPDFLALPS